MKEHGRGLVESYVAMLQGLPRMWMAEGTWGWSWRRHLGEGGHWEAASKGGGQNQPQSPASGVGAGQAPHTQIDAGMKGRPQGEPVPGQLHRDTHELLLKLPCSRFIRLVFFFCTGGRVQLSSRSACPAGQHRTQ